MHPAVHPTLPCTSGLAATLQQRPRRVQEVDVRLPGKGNPNSRGARPVYQIIFMIQCIRTNRLSMVVNQELSLSADSNSDLAFHCCRDINTCALDINLESVRISIGPANVVPPYILPTVGATPAPPSDVERTRHVLDCQGQILALAFR